MADRRVVASEMLGSIPALLTKFQNNRKTVR